MENSKRVLFRVNGIHSKKPLLGILEAKIELTTSHFRRCVITIEPSVRLSDSQDREVVLFRACQRNHFRKPDDFRQQ